MPIALIVIAVVLIVTAYRNTYADVGTLLVGDFTGSNSFLYWFGAIVIIGMAGYVPVIRSPSRAFLALILVAMFLSNGGFWDSFTSAIKNAKAEPAPKDAALTGSPTISVSLGGGSSGSSASLGGSDSASTISSAVSIGETAAMFLI